MHDQTHKPTKKQPEADLQRAVWTLLKRASKPDVFYFHVPNGGYRSPLEAAIMKGLGVVAGVPDMIIIYDGKTYGLELKSKRGRVTGHQSDVMRQMERAGAHCAVAHSIDDAITTLQSWRVLRMDR